MKFFESSYLGGIKLLLQSHPDVAVLARILQQVKRGAGIEQLGVAQLDLAHAKQTADKREHSHGIPAIGAFAEVTEDFLDRSALPIVLIPHHVGKNFLLCF